MCMSAPKIPKPAPAPAPPNPREAAFDAAEYSKSRQGRAGTRQSTLVSRLSDGEVADSATKKRLLGE